MRINLRLLRILAPPAVFAAFIGLLMGLSLTIRAVLGLSVFGGAELFLFGSVVSSTFAVAALGELIPATFRPKRFLIGFAAPVFFCSCALIGFWVRTGEGAMPDATTSWGVLLMGLAGGLLVHFGSGKKQASPPNTSLERTREE